VRSVVFAQRIDPLAAGSGAADGALPVQTISRKEFERVSIATAGQLNINGNGNGVTTWRMFPAAKYATQPPAPGRRVLRAQP
jgi:hypothetical protein